MIPKATVQELAATDGVQASTVEKDYALGWVLYGVARHPMLSRWVFKGGTCLKKCFFETYRFSEDLDFTVPSDVELSAESIGAQLAEICEWVSEEAGIQFSAERIDVEQYTNPQGTESFTARLYYSGPLQLSRGNSQRIKFDITQHEVLVDPPQHRPVFHRYQDRIEPTPTVACYTVNEILAEKSRALYERRGRARDVYDVVNIDRNFREEVDPARAREILLQKFAFKNLPSPTVDLILARIDTEGLSVAWEQQLAHQLPFLPPIETFISALRDALVWWIDGIDTRPQLAPAPLGKGEQAVPRERHVANVIASPMGAQRGGGGEAQATSVLETIRFAARNRLCVEIRYHNVARIVEPYSLRIASTGNRNLYAYELTRGGHRSNQIKSFHVREIRAAAVQATPFTPRWRVEL